MRRTVREKQEKKKKRREENRIESCRAEQSRSLSSVIILFDPILVMGNAAAKALASFISCGTKDVRILMVGLDGAGKTTILYKLRLGEYVRTVPTIGFNVETVKFKNLSFTVWDVGGQDKIRHLWKQYMVNTQGLIFVIDSCDKERLKKAKQELDSLLNDPELSCVKLLVLANKQDLPSAMKATDVGERLGLSNSNSSNDSNNIRKCYIQGCSGKTGQGLNDALEWLASAMKEPNILQRVGSLRMTRSLSQSTGRLRRDGRHYLCWARRPKSCKKTLKTHQAQPQPQPQTQSCSST